jgi:hypothetical protein
MEESLRRTTNLLRAIGIFGGGAMVTPLLFIGNIHCLREPTPDAS